MLKIRITQLRQIALFAVGMSLLTACGNSQSGMKMGDNEFAVMTVNATTSNQTTSYPATIKGTQDIEIRPKVSGHITKLCVDEGDFVKKGQPLFLIDRVQYEAAVRSAEANVNVLQANLNTLKLTVDNKRALHDKAIISDYDYEMAQNQLKATEAQLAQAKAQLVSARNDLSFCTVTSPADGVVGEIPYRVGSLVSSSTAEPLTTVSNIGQMFVYFAMTEKQLLDLTRSTGGITEAVNKMPAVTLMLADGTKYAESGTVSNVSGVIDQTTGSVNMRATFPNPAHVLRSGGTGSVLVPTHAKDAIVIPQKATYEIQDKKFVYLVGSGNKVKSTEITVLSQNDGQNYVVTSGLKAGDRVVVDGVSTLKDGTQINPITPAQADANRRKAEKDMAAGKMF